MIQCDLDRLSREELIELVLWLQRPEKTSRTSSKLPATDRKEQRVHSKRALSNDSDTIVEHHLGAYTRCGGSMHATLPVQVVSAPEQIALPAVVLIVTQHQRRAVRCPTCNMRVIAPAPKAARGMPFAPQLHAVATNLKTFQALSYERLQAALMLLCPSSGFGQARTAGSGATELAEDLPGHVPFQAPDDLPLRPSLGEALLDIG